VVHCPCVGLDDNGTALGVDLGVCRPAVTSDNRFHGIRRWREVEKRRFRLRRKLQANGCDNSAPINGRASTQSRPRGSFVQEHLY